MPWRKTNHEDWLDCNSPAWLQGYDDGFAGRQPDGSRDGTPHSQLSREHRNYRDGFTTGQTEHEFESG